MPAPNRLNEISLPVTLQAAGWPSMLVAALRPPRAGKDRHYELGLRTGETLTCTLVLPPLPGDEAWAMLQEVEQTSPRWGGGTVLREVPFLQVRVADIVWVAHQ